MHPHMHVQGNGDGVGNGAGGGGGSGGGGGDRGDDLRMRDPMHSSSHVGPMPARSARRDAREREFDRKARTSLDDHAEEEEPEGKTPRGIEPLQPRTLSEAGTLVRAWECWFASLPRCREWECGGSKHALGNARKECASHEPTENHAAGRCLHCPLRCLEALANHWQSGRKPTRALDTHLL